MNVYYFIPIALGVVATGVPLIIAKRHQGRILSQLIADIGSRQRYFHKAPAGETISSLINASRGAHIRVITNDFRIDKWGKSTKWFKFIEDHLSNGVKVTAYGKVGASKSTIDELVAKGMELICLKETPSEHYVTVDNPRQIWVEGRHRGYYAYNCIYTDSPYPEVWDRLDNYFRNLENIGIVYNKENKKS